MLTLCSRDGRLSAGDSHVSCGNGRVSAGDSHMFCGDGRVSAGDSHVSCGDGRKPLEVADSEQETQAGTWWRFTSQ